MSTKEALLEGEDKKERPRKGEWEDGNSRRNKGIGARSEGEEGAGIQGKRIG